MNAPHDEIAKHRDHWGMSFEIAENLLKRSELHEQAVSIPILNELRYSAEHVRRALCLDCSVEERISQWKKAVDHCTRAQYDAAEIIVISQLETIDRFRDEFDKYSITIDAERVTAAYTAAREARRKLRDAALKRDQRGAKASEMLAVSDMLAPHVDALDALKHRYRSSVSRTRNHARLAWLGAFMSLAMFVQGLPSCVEWGIATYERLSGAPSPTECAEMSVGKPHRRDP